VSQDRQKPKEKIPKDALQDLVTKIGQIPEEYQTHLAPEIIRLQNWLADDHSIKPDKMTDRGELEITKKKQADAGLQYATDPSNFLVKLSDALRSLADPVEIQAAAAQVLGKHLGANQAHYGETVGDVVIIHQGYGNGLPPMVGAFRHQDFGKTLVETYRAGKTAVCRSVTADNSITSAEQAVIVSAGFRAYIAVPLVKAGEWVATLAVHSIEPRNWTPEEVALVEETAERTWAAVERARAEEALRNSEQKFRTLADTAPALIWYNGATGENLFVNQYFLDYTGLAEGEIQGERWHSLVHPDEAAAYIADYIAAVQDQRAWYHRNRIRRHDGVWHWFDNYAQPLFNHDGRYLGHVGVSTDVNTTVEAEEALRKSEARFRALSETSPLGVSVISTEGKVIYTNRAYEEILGYEPDGLLGQPATSLYYDAADREVVLAALEENGRLSHYDTRFRRKDGSQVWVSINKSHIDFGGRPAIIGIIQDATERKSAELALKKSEERFRTSLDSLAEAFVMYSAVRKDGKIVDLRYEYVNSEACKFHKLTREEMVGHTILQIIPAVKETGLFDQYLQVIETGQPLKGRRFIPHKEGGRSRVQGVFDYRVSKFGDGMIITANDVTEQVRLEAEHHKNIQEQELQRRLMDYRDQERQAIARELHDGPVQDLSSLLFTIQLVKEVSKDPSMQSELENIAEGVRTSVQNLRDMINLIRPPSLIRFGLAKAVSVSLEDYRERHSEIEFNTSLENDQNCLPEPARLGMFRIFQEALTNISKHAHAKRVEVSLHCEDHQVVMEIQDDGDGFQLSENLLDYSSQGHFGLIGMKERADAAGGKFQVTSAPGKGTNIRVIVPTDTSRS
jgi:PAS domain S-box-containing protein